MDSDDTNAGQIHYAEFKIDLADDFFFFFFWRSR